MPFAVLDNELLELISDADFAYSVILEERFNTVNDGLRAKRPAAFIRSATEVENVVIQLLGQSKYDPFHRIIKETWNIFTLGSLHTIRDVEVFLLAGLRVSHFRPISLAESH